MLRGLRSIRADPLGFLAEQQRRHGDLIQFPIPQPPTYLVSHPDDVREVLVRAARTTTKNTLQYRALARVTGWGLLTADGQRWRDHRRLVQPAFHPSTLPVVVEHTGRAAQELIAALRQDPGRPVDLDPLLMRLALAVVGDALFGHGLADQADELAEATLVALAEVVSLARMPLRAPARIPTPGNRRMARALRTLDDGVARILADGRGAGGRAERTPGGGAGGGRGAGSGRGAGGGSRAGADSPATLLDLLRDSDLTAREVRDEMVTFLVAGHETVASALLWAILLLAEHPEVADRVADEAAEVLEAGGGPASMAQLSRLRFTRAVVDEALRLYPPAWLITRKAEAEIMLRDGPVPAGALLILSPWITHRHPAAWADADFRPERFLDAATRSGFLPFGLGPRMCIGRDFAYAEAVLTLALVCREVRWTTVGPPVRPTPLVTIRPDRPVHLLVTTRA